MDDEKKVEKKVEKKHRPKEERKELMKQYKLLRKQGENAVAAAKKVGVPYITLRSWEVKKHLKKLLHPVNDSTLALQRGAKPRKRVEKASKVREAVQSLPKFKGRVAIIICENLSDATVILKSVK